MLGNARGIRSRTIATCCVSRSRQRRPGGRQGVLELYRSGGFEKLEAYEGQLSRLGMPTLVLWGENDLFAPVAGAYRFQREIPDAKVVVLEGAGHFVYADEPLRCAREVAEFLAASGV